MRLSPAKESGNVGKVSSPMKYDNYLRNEFIDISHTYLATNLHERVKNMDYEKLRILIWYRMYRLYIFW